MQHITNVIDQLKRKLVRQLTAVDDTRQHILYLETLDPKQLEIIPTTEKKK